MYIGDFINYVKKMRAAQIARKAGSKPDAILAWELEKEVDRGLAEGITVVEAVEVSQPAKENSLNGEQL